jgi:hypothetical protein
MLTNYCMWINRRDVDKLLYVDQQKRCWQTTVCGSTEEMLTNYCMWINRRDVDKLLYADQQKRCWQTTVCGFSSLTKAHSLHGWHRLNYWCSSPNLIGLRIYNVIREIKIFKFLNLFQLNQILYSEIINKGFNQISC